MKMFRFVICLALLSGFLAFAQVVPSVAYTKDAVITETAGTVHITANNPRPLEQILGALQRKFGWVVNYEDPQYVAPVDLVVERGGEHSQLPAGGSFSVDFSATAPDEEQTLRRIVDSYNRSKNPGRFELRRSVDGNFYVIGTAAYDQKGNISPQEVPFDRVLTLPSEEQTIGDAVDRICHEISKQMHSDLQVAISPRSLLFKTRATIGGTKIAARDLLVQSLLATHQKLYWRLFFDPSTQTYLLNIHAIQLLGANKSADDSRSR